MKPLKIAAIGFAALSAVVVLAAIFGVPAGFLANYAQDQAIRAGYRLRIDGNSWIALRPVPTLTARRVHPQRRRPPHDRPERRGRRRAGLFVSDEPSVRSAVDHRVDGDEAHDPRRARP